MSEMVERVAAALRVEDRKFPPDFETDDELLTRFARAAIEAMREPTDAMIHAGADKADMARTDALLVWRAGIDEALK